MQNDGKFAGNGNLGFAQPASLRQPNAPGFEHRPLCDTGEQYIGCFVKITSQHRIAAFRDSPRPIDLAGCVSPGCQSNIGPMWMVVRIRAKMAQRKKLAWPLRLFQPLLAVERLVANDGWVASRVKAVSRRRRGPQARLYRACHPAISTTEVDG